MTTTYKIGEAAALLNLKTYVLRFWETEFPDIAPLRTEKGQRLYTEEHLALLQRIRYLLHERGLTIGGARKALAEEKERGLVYEFKAAGGISRTAGVSVRDAWQPDPTGSSYPDDGEEEAEPEDASADPPADEPSFDSQADAPGGSHLDKEAAGGPLDAPIDDSLFLAPPSGSSSVVLPFPGRESPRRSGQYNLPGLEELVAMRGAALDSRAGAEYGLPEEPGEESRTEERDGQGMLPLFAVGAAHPAASSLGGPGVLPEREGENFIQAGSSLPEKLAPAIASLDAVEPVAAHPNGGDAPVHASLLEIVPELEAVAAILRRNGAERGQSASATPLTEPLSKA